ncbi:MAG: hypothetical protein OEW48_19945 [Phycisphaerae bacterium]|nr:hypothetical protein [Phycisphaerae bacterium]
MFSKNTKFRFQNILIFILFMFIIGAIAIGETIYEQNTESSIGDMTSETVATTPANRSRTTIGIGEEVVCRIDSNSWADTDCEKVDDGPWTEVNDTIGDRVWACSSGGTINPSGVTSSNTTTLTADKSPDICVVGVDVYDSEDKFDDDAIWKSITFDIIAPDSSTYVKNSDSPTWTAWTSGTKNLGARTLYDVTEGPTTVSFYNVEFREHFTGETDTWPKTTTWNAPSADIYFGVNQANQSTDEQKTGLYDSNNLYTGTEWQNFSPSFSIYLQYKNQAGVWTGYNTVTATRNYYHTGRTARVGVDGVNGGTQGPWQSP